MDKAAFLGTGWHFPPDTDPATGRIKMAEYEDDIKESIRLILGTRKGERVMRPEFGSLLHTYVFETFSLSSVSMVADEVKNSLTLWEPRISDIEVYISEDEANNGLLNISISYRVRTTNNPYNMVYPFYLKEGSYE